MSSISTHVLDTARGVPAAGIKVRLEAEASGAWTLLGESLTNADGRVVALAPPDTVLVPGVYRLRFDTGAYQAGFYP